MQSPCRGIGNHKAFVLPKRVLARAGLDGQGNLNATADNGTIVLRKPCKSGRAGLAVTAKAIVAQDVEVL
jgi:antitoxin MazE